MSVWPLEKLGSVLDKSENWIEVQPDKEYSEVTVRLWGKGVNLRGIKIGSEIGSSRRLSVSEGQFIISRIDARHGACGLVPRNLDGAVVTNDFPVYTPKENKILPRYLELISKTHFFVDACKRASEGTTNRVRLKEPRFFNIEIPLPDIAVQKVVVDKVDFALGKLEEIKLLRSSLLDDAQAMLSSAFHKIIEGAVYKPMSAVAPIVRRQIEITVDGEYPELGARSFGKGIFHKPTLIGAELDWQKLYTVHSGDLVLSNIKAWEGAIAAAGDNDHGRVGSHRYITCVPVEGVTTANFLAFYLLTQEGIEQVQAASPGSADRNRTLAMKRLEKIKVPVPDYDKQLWFNQLQSYVGKIKQAQSENEIELEALMPSILDKAFKGELV
ncbi:TPA: restriction endonuclease subunit S [Proteus mirabilis]|uniref:restriction endonuclease subunit S n=1 Tax=Proteus mirabilis TaxID=584 RepID=UPI00126140A3|nr:restriction endonuclease subunit S [Proteus mirabilis]MCA7214083.1 restriction endonuclease subunit S [Escherichia coli]KAB7726768.1 restriction endonuclease subunit S [Proteus mirabilis]MBS3869957.1 restriction endonuclease subunit S [Proteus mirabilis]MCA7305419.1 restriction endonuclease subunit S [Escherichia coli]MCA7457154.1 restriction endonuclease subunit S [Escherichia coli]